MNPISGNLVSDHEDMKVYITELEQIHNINMPNMMKRCYIASVGLISKPRSQNVRYIIIII